VKKLLVFSLVSVLMLCAFGTCYGKVLVKDKSVVKISEDINMGQDLRFKSLVAIKGNINVKGIVDEDVVAVLGTVHVFPTARIAGDVVAIGGRVVKDAGSKIKGNIVELAISKEGLNLMESYAPVIGFVSIGGYLMFKALVLLGFIGLSMILVSFMTRQLGAISSKIEKEWLNTLLWGILGALLICPVAFLLAVTVVGIPLILIEVVLVSVAMTMGYVAVSQLIGKKFTKAVRKPNQQMITEIIWGLVILFLVDLIPVVGTAIKCLAVTMGFGSAIVTKLGTK